MKLRISAFCFLLLFAVTFPNGEVSAEKPNVLIVTVDDMSCDSVGAFGCELPGTTPNIDQFAQAGYRFQHAHVQVGNCYPSRNVLFSGRYPHNTGVEGFYAVKDREYPHLVDIMQKAGYFVGIRGKATHSTPYYPYHWDVDLSVLDGKKQDIKNADSYYQSTRKGIELAEEAGKPFCLSVNISDPHKPFYAMGKKGMVVEDKNVPSKVFSADEVPIPGFLFDHPDVRLELAHYYSSVRRADDCFGSVMKALEESGQRDNTVIMFLSDHGMPLPFAKTAIWHHSTLTPWIVSWPGVTKPGTTDSSHMISAVDMLPTLLDMLGIAHPDGFDGKSFAPVLKGEVQQDRGLIFKVYNENSGGNRSPMRGIQSKRFGYNFNAWSDGNRVFKTATTGTLSYRAMVKLAETNPEIASRLKHFRHNTLEEFYDYQNDPDALNNLIDDPAFADEIDRHRKAMQAVMERSNDPMLEVFLKRDDLNFVSQYVERVQAESDKRRANRNKNKNQNKSKLFQIKAPDAWSAGGEFPIRVQHNLPQNLGAQKFTITIKDENGNRLDRKIESASGKGRMDLTFDIKEDIKANSISVVVYVGEDFDSRIAMKNSGPVPKEE